MRESFLHDVERTLQPGGSLHFWTDVEEYFQTTLELLAACTTLAGPAAGARDARPSTTWPIARTSSAACDRPTSRSIGRSSGRNVPSHKPPRLPQPPRRLAPKMLQCRLPKTRTEPTWWTALWTSLCRGDRSNPPPNKAARSLPCHFLAGPENRLVEVAVRSRRRRSRRNGYNPLVFYGPSGTGKSHLAHGLAAAWKARDRRQRVVCTTAVDFARELADAIETPGRRRVSHEVSHGRPAGRRRPRHVGHAEVGQTERPGGVDSHAGRPGGRRSLGGGDGLGRAGRVARHCCRRCKAA